MRVCNVPGCGQLTDQPRCPEHRRAADAARQDRGVYSKAPHRRFRRLVLKRDPVCVVCNTAPSTVADHYPVSRRDLVAAGLNPNDPKCGRGLCHRCHSKETAANPAQRGGWHADNP